VYLSHEIRFAKLWQEPTEQAILKRYGNSAYKSELPATISIQPVVSVAALEPAPKGEDPYHGPRETGQDPVFDNDADGTMDHY